MTDGSSLLQVRKSVTEQVVVSGELLIAEAAQSLIDHVDLRGDANGCVVIRLQGARSHVLAASADFPLGPGDLVAAPAWPSTNDTSSPIVVPDSSRCSALREVAAAANVVVHSACIAPLAVHGDVVGAVIGTSFEAQAEDLQRSADSTSALAAVLGTLWEAHVTAAMARGYAARMEQLAVTDALTELPNRRGWQEGLHREELRRARHGYDVAVVVVDLDDLKPINDTFGHAAGDEMIRLAAQTLRSVVRGGDLLARTGGDEFGILAVHCTGGVEAIRQRVIAVLAEAGVGASVGAALAQRPDKSLTDAWQEADTLMYLAKRDQRRDGRV